MVLGLVIIVGGKFLGYTVENSLIIRGKVFEVTTRSESKSDS